MQRAPGIPHALFCQRASGFTHHPGVIRRGRRGRLSKCGSLKLNWQRSEVSGRGVTSREENPSPQPSPTRGEGAHCRRGLMGGFFGVWVPARASLGRDDGEMKCPYLPKSCFMMPFSGALSCWREGSFGFGAEGLFGEGGGVLLPRAA